MPIKKTIVIINGWGQNHKSISDNLFSKKDLENVQIVNIDYSAMKEDELLSFIKSNIHNPDLLIGWSLGGYLASKAIALSSIKPKELLLISPIFQFVRDSIVKSGMEKILFNNFRKSFHDYPDKLLRRFALMISHNDKNATEVNSILNNFQANNNKELHDNWEYWLDYLETSSALDFDFSKFPQTTIIHGKVDIIVKPRQGERYRENIKNSKIIFCPNASHAPHFSNKEFVRELIMNILKK